mgnify:CR=1 FL=1
MGNTPSTDNEKNTNEKNTKSLSNVVDFIATNYILTTNFQDMKNLQNINYCNDLVVLTSKILSEKLNTLEIDYLAQRIKEGEVVNEMANDKVIYSYKDGFKNLDEKNSTTVLNHLLTLRDRFNVSILMVTHDKSIAEGGDFVYEMTDGKLLSV